MRRAVLFIFIIFLLISPYSLATDLNFQVYSPQITSTYTDYDIKSLSCEEDSNLTITLEVWGNINVHPAKGYIKEYDVNITDVYGNYVHIFLMSDDGKEPISFVSVCGKIELVNYSINNSTLQWILPHTMFENISGDPKVKAHAGIVDISKEEYLFLDKVIYPSPEKGEDLRIYYVLIGVTVVAIGIILYFGIRKLRK